MNSRRASTTSGMPGIVRNWAVPCHVERQDKTDHNYSRRRPSGHLSCWLRCQTGKDNEGDFGGSGDPFEGEIPATTPVGYYDKLNGYGLYNTASIIPPPATLLDSAPHFTWSGQKSGSRYGRPVIRWHAPHPTAHWPRQTLFRSVCCTEYFLRGCRKCRFLFSFEKLFQCQFDHTDSAFYNLFPFDV